LYLFSLLKAYIQEWSKFYEQCEYLPKPFIKIETTINGIPSSNSMNYSDKISRNTDQVRQLMLESWNNNIFKDIKHRLQVKFTYKNESFFVVVVFLE
jgi:cullin-5